MTQETQKTLQAQQTRTAVFTMIVLDEQDRLALRQFVRVLEEKPQPRQGPLQELRYSRHRSSQRTPSGRNSHAPV
ncbi:MAG: hypothetical protein HY581_05830 [Nitrospirae bacterium]|nr:hypothetical protein [Nitrospirota bacterium]